MPVAVATPDRSAALVQERSNGLQALRGIAALMVVGAHCGYFMGLEKVVPYNGTPLQGGVDIFFVISGFVMFTILERSPSGPKGAARFVWHRAVRLMPMYWLLTGLGWWWLATFGYRFHPGEVLRSFLLIPAHYPDGRYLAPLLPVGWSLIFEVWFYGMIAGAIALGLRRWAALAAVTAVLAGTWAMDGLTAGAIPELHFYGRQVCLEFSAGGVLALTSGWLRGLHPSLGVAMLAVAAVSGVAAPPSPGPMGHHSLAWAVSAFLACAGGVIAERAIDWRRWTHRAAVRIGDLSYSLYLIHYPIVGLIGRLILPLLVDRMGVFFAVAAYLSAMLALILALAATTHQRIERPANKRLRNLFNGA